MKEESVGRTEFRGIIKDKGMLDWRQQAAVAQSVERVLGKDEVKGSSPLSSSWSAARSRLSARVAA